MDLAELIEYLENEIKNSEYLNDNPNEASWNKQIGVLMTANQAKEIVRHLQS